MVFLGGGVDRGKKLFTFTAKQPIFGPWLGFLDHPDTSPHAQGGACPLAAICQAHKIIFCSAIIHLEELGLHSCPQACHQHPDEHPAQSTLPRADSRNIIVKVDGHQWKIKEATRRVISPSLPSPAPLPPSQINKLMGLGMFPSKGLSDQLNSSSGLVLFR